jgi:hypothetical protein
MGTVEKRVRACIEIMVAFVEWRRNVPGRCSARFAKMI